MCTQEVMKKKTKIIIEMFWKGDKIYTDFLIILIIGIES